MLALARFRWAVLSLGLTLGLAYILTFQHFGKHHLEILESWRDYLDIRDGRLDRIVRTKVLVRQLQDRFASDKGEQARLWNVERLNALAECMAANSCGQNQTKIVVLASGHFGDSHFGRVSGEDIWALAVSDAVETLGYTALYCYGHTEAIAMWLALPDMIEHFFMEASHIRSCVARSPEHMENHMAHGDFGEWQHARIGCIRTPMYEEGIPIWRIHAFHGWSSPAHPLGANFTVSLEPFKQLGVGENYYIGYTIEKRCRAIPTNSSRSHRGLILGKEPAYFQPPRNKFAGMMHSAAAGVSHELDVKGDDVEFGLVAVAGHGVELDEPGVVNLGFRPMAEWYAEVARSKVMIGLGDPPQSPSPYDAMCLGVPFINPIRGWDEKDPMNRAKWNLQQPALVTEYPPHVYHVFANDEEGLRQALQDAVDHPIDRYIPERMTTAAMLDRMSVFLNVDWEDIAKQQTADMNEMGLMY